MKQCAFLSMENMDDFVCYDHLLVEPMAQLGWEVQEMPWRNKQVDWNQFDAVIIRSPWDYQDDPALFLDVITAIDQSSAHLENALKIVRWNLDKRYLKEMAAKDIPIVPTRWYDKIDTQNATSLLNTFDTPELIIKPVVSANADDTWRLDKDKTDYLPQSILETFRDRPLMVQPFLNNIVKEGEFSLFYFGGNYSHAILKTPEAGDFRVQEEHGSQLKRVEPEVRLRNLGRQTMQALPEIPLYARIDFVRRDDTFLLMELELIEPSLYFNLDETSPRRFARAFDERMKNVV